MRRTLVYSPYLEQDFRPHAEEAIYDTEGEYHRHAVDEPVEIDESIVLECVSNDVFT